MRILCVDDDEDTAFLLKTMLGSFNLEAITAPNASAALRLMATEQFSLYIIDGEMPEIGGLTFCEEIRRVDKTTPVIFFTGRAHAADREAGMLAGANAYIVKPGLSEIIPTVKRLLGLTHPRDAHPSDDSHRTTIENSNE